MQKVFEKILAEFGRQIGMQLKIMAGLEDDSWIMRLMNLKMVGFYVVSGCQNRMPKQWEFPAVCREWPPGTDEAGQGKEKI